MQVDIVTLFPGMFEALSGSGISGRAIRNSLVSLHMHNPRDFAEDRHQSVDDRPYGGGPGMVMTVPPLSKAIQSARARAGSEKNGNERPPVIYLSPQGKPLDQARVVELATLPQLILLCGRYEGIDERIVEAEVDEELSIGDYVISGGELAAMVLLDAIVRQIPGALGDDESAVQDSYMDGLLDCPHYSRPEEINGRRVPAVLLSGDHQAIRRWRRQQALLRTRERRPDLFSRLALSDEDRELLDRAESDN